MLMKFNLYRCINLVLDSMEDILGSINGKDRSWWDKHIFYSGKSHKLPSYPYMSYNIPTPHRMENRDPSYTFDQFESTINCNIYDKDSPEFPINSVVQLHYELKDDYHRHLFHSNGFAVAAVSANGDSNNDIDNTNDIYAQNIQVKIRLLIHHQTTFPKITGFNINNND